MKTLILTHADSDGICAGAIGKNAYPDARVFFTNPVGLLDDLGEAEKYDNILICDVAVDMVSNEEIRSRINTLAEERNIRYIDHHPTPPWDEPWFFSDTDACGAELTMRVLDELAHPDMSRVAIIGAIGDFADQTPYVREMIKHWDKRSLYYEAGTLIQGIEEARRDYNYKRKIVSAMSQGKIPSHVPGLADKAIKASQFEEQLRLRVRENVKRMRSLAYVVDANGYLSKAAIYSGVYGNRPVGVAAQHRGHKPVFDLSIRSRNKIHLNEILQRIAPKYDGHGGGHPNAGGARIPEKHLDAFLHDLDRSIGREEGS